MTSDDVLRPIDPATGQALGPIPATDPEELDRLVQWARRAQPGWAASLQTRKDGIRRFIQRVKQADVTEHLAQTICSEMGKPIRQARAEVESISGRTEGFLALAETACADEVAREGSIEVVTQWRPLGVIAVIAPWNFPVATPNNLVMSGLLVGNAVVLKPSEQTPRTGAIYAELLREYIGEVVQVVQGAGSVGRRLIQADVDMVAFTGSVATGQAIMREAAETMKRLVLEMGGKDPMLVLPGADLARAADHAVRSALSNSGQVCVAPERILVHADVHDAFVAAVVERVGRIRVGDPRRDDTDMGPLASEHQRDIVMAHIADARAQGARLVVEGSSRSPGYFLGPTVIDGVHGGMRVAREETFGPVIAIESVDSAETAVARANETKFGLGASVWGPEGEELEQICNRIEAGMIGMNRGLSAAAGAPWVGWKMSGFGYSRSVAGFRQFMQPRTISRNISGT